jgi:hypothetical protein
MNMISIDLENLFSWAGVLAICLIIIVVNEAVHRGWVIRRLLRLDEWVNYNVMNGRKGETISTRTYRAVWRKEKGIPEKGDWVWYVLNWLLNLIDPEHCRESYERAKELGRVSDPLE